METRPPPSWPVPGSPPVPLVAPASHFISASPWAIWLWNPQPSRLQCISPILAGCGPRLCCNEEILAILQVERSRARSFAIVALEACPTSGAPGVETIRSYGDGMLSWLYTYAANSQELALSGYLTAPQAHLPINCEASWRTFFREKPANGTKRHSMALGLSHNRLGGLHRLVKPWIDAPDWPAHTTSGGV